MPKRHLSSDGALQALRARLLARIASLLDRPEEDLREALTKQPSMSLMELGLTSAMGVALKGWVFKELEAELTSFELLKCPVNEVLLSIEAAQRQDVGVKLPGAAPAEVPTY